MAGHLQGLGVHHHDVRATGNEQTLGVSVVGEVVPTAFTAEFYAMGELEGFLSGCGNCSQRSRREDQSEDSFHDFSFLLSAVWFPHDLGNSALPE